MDGWMDGRANLRIAYSNSNQKYIIIIGFSLSMLKKSDLISSAYFEGRLQKIEPIFVKAICVVK